jgi:radical SAM superfamily enzyme YgiQ (UPF0313 family)
MERLCESMNFLEQIAAEKHLLSYPYSPHGPVGLISPNAYTVGIAGLGFQQIYRLFREAGVSVERIFFDKKGRETRSVENRTPLFRFPVIAASYTFELDILNLITMLIRGGVSPLSDERGEESPIIMVGGMAATANPPLLQRIADVVVLGEGETVVEAIAETLIRTKGQTRTKIVAAMAELPYIYAPAIHGNFFSELISSHQLESFDRYPCHSVILAPDDEFGGAFLLEMSRGCSYRCRFCVVHYMNGSARYREYDLLIDIMDRFKHDYRKVGLLGAAVADHPRVEDVAEWLVRNGKQVSTSSLRAEKITERFLDLLKAAGQHGITVAPETGSLATRKNMLKGVKDEKYFQLVEWAGKRRFPNMKLYFLLGLPGEDPMDEAEEIIQFSQSMSELFSSHGGGRMTVSVSPFVPKPTTPWAGAGIWDAKSVKKAARHIRKQLAFRGNLKVPAVNVKEARAEIVLTWAGPEITEDLIRLAQGEIPIESAFLDFDLSRISGRSFAEPASVHPS